MAICETCGNDYDKTFQVIMKGKTHLFDSFECRSEPWRRPARIAAHISWATGWKTAAGSSAASIARRAKV